MTPRPEANNASHPAPSLAPRPYPDELLWGYLGRLRMHWTLRSASSANRWLHGKTRVQPCSDLVGQAQALGSRLRSLRLSGEELVHQHTLLPYYLAFRPAVERSAFLARTCHSSALGLHVALGICSSVVKAPSYLRFCPDCWEVADKQHGEVYLRRLFQLPGVLVCPEHRAQLLDTGIRYRHVAQREYRPVSLRDATTSSSARLTRQGDVAIAAKIASASQELLRVSASCAADASDLPAIYRRALRRIGLAGQSRVSSRLEKMFLEYVPMSFLSDLGLAFSPGAEHNWLRKFVRAQRHAQHPLLHLLFRAFIEAKLGTSCWADLAHESWPCLSPLTPHPGSIAVSVTKLAYHPADDRWSGIFACTCGFRYSAEGPGAPSPATLRLRKVVAHSRCLHDQVRASVLLSQSPAEIARALKVDRRTVQSIIERPSMDGRTLRKKWSRDADRRRWLALRKANPESTTVQLRRRANALYGLLRRNDKAWLAQHGSPAPKHGGKRRDTHWKELDTKLSWRVKAIAGVISLREPPQRVTVSRIGKELGALTLLKHALPKLPATRAMLDARIETWEAFRMRRHQKVTAQGKASSSSALPPANVIGISRTQSSQVGRASGAPLR